MTDMTYREMNRRIFERRRVPHVLFQPRFEPWYAWQKLFGTLPPIIEGMSIDQVYDHVGCSMRYVDYYTPNPSPMVGDFSPQVKVSVQTTDDLRTSIYHTPHGDLQQVEELTVDGAWRVVEFLGKSTDDLDALGYLMQRLDRRVNLDHLAQGDAWLGDRGEPQFYIVKSPYMALAQQFMRFEAFIFAMADAPKKMEAIMDAIDRAYDPLFEDLCTCGVKIVNFGENIAEAYMSPAYLQQYMLPWYHKRVGQLREAGVFTHIHIDGYFKTLLPHLKDFPHDGLEALTPLPQGDVSLEQIAEHIGDHILLDGIPAILFLDHHPREQLQACVERVVELFHPRLVLGVSDELPQAATAEGFERLKWVADYARQARTSPTD